MKLQIYFLLGMILAARPAALASQITNSVDLTTNLIFSFTAIPQYLRKSWNILFSPATRQG
jgi:hypothetical protein